MLMRACESEQVVDVGDKIAEAGEDVIDQGAKGGGSAVRAKARDAKLVLTKVGDGKGCVEA